MKNQKQRNTAVHLLVTVGCAVIVIGGMKLAQSFFIPILLAAFIATISFPITGWLMKHRVPRSIAVLLTVLIDFAFLIGIILICISLLGDLETKWQDTYYPALTQRIDEASEATVGLLEKFDVKDARMKVEAYGLSNIQEQFTGKESMAKLLDLGTKFGDGNFGGFPLLGSTSRFFLALGDFGLCSQFRSCFGLSDCWGAAIYSRAFGARRAQRDGDCDWIHFDQRFPGKFFGADADGSPFWAFDPGGDCFRPILGVYLGTGGNAPRSSSYDGFESDAR